MLKSIYSNSTGNVELWAILVCFMVAIILGFIIAFTHMKTSKYSKNFLVTLTVLPLLVSAVMVMVNGNLGTSVAIVGAFGLVRFRSIPGTSKEILSVFFAMAVGLSLGMGHIFFACLVTIFTSLIIFLFSKINLFEVGNQERILKVTVPENLDYTNMFEDIFKEYTKHVELESVKTTNMGSLFELHYRVIFNKSKNEKEFLDEIRVKNGNLKISFSHPIDTTEI